MILSEEPLLIASSYLSTSTLFSTSFDAVGHIHFWNIFPLLSSMIHPLIFPSFFLTLFKHTFKEENHRLLCSWSHFLLFLHSSSCLISPYKKKKKSTTISMLATFQFQIWLLFRLRSERITVTWIKCRNLHPLQILTMIFHTILKKAFLCIMQVYNLNTVFLSL